MIEYWRNPEATAKKYAGDFLLTGDLGVQDEDGYFWYVSREDDVITTAGYRVGPSEIEHTLMKHPAVAMSAVVGIPDPIRTESIKAWIVLRSGFAASDELAREIQEFVKVQLAAHEYPRFVQFAETLPMTATGKVLRRELRALGLAWVRGANEKSCQARCGPASRLAHEAPRFGRGARAHVLRLARHDADGRPVSCDGWAIAPASPHSLCRCATADISIGELIEVLGISKQALNRPLSLLLAT
jgi:hypothetical protein